MIEINKIHQEDCLELMKDIEDKSIDLLCTDPPYQQSFNGKGSMESRFAYRRDEMQKISQFDPLPFLELIKPKLKVFNAYIWTSKDLLDIYIKWAKDNKYNWDILLYIKRNPVPAYNNSYLSDVEYCLFIREKGATFNNGLGYDTYKKAMIDNVNNSGIGHPTVKHLWMIKKQILISTKPDDVILDPFVGSGTTCVACKELGRNFIGFEISKEYVDIAEKRLRNTQDLNKKDLFNY